MGKIYKEKFYICKNCNIWDKVVKKSFQKHHTIYLFIYLYLFTDKIMTIPKSLCDNDIMYLKWRHLLERNTKIPQRLKYKYDSQPIVFVIIHVLLGEVNPKMLAMVDFYKQNQLFCFIIAQNVQI